MLLSRRIFRDFFATLFAVIRWILALFLYRSLKAFLRSGRIPQSKILGFFKGLICLGETMQLLSISFLNGVVTVLNLALWVVPLFALVAADPSFAVNLAIDGIAEVDLLAPVTLIVVLVALVTVLAEADD